jgi:hypothetical protein
LSRNLRNDVNIIYFNYLLKLHLIIYFYLNIASTATKVLESV